MSMNRKENNGLFLKVDIVYGNLFSMSSLKVLIYG